MQEFFQTRICISGHHGLWRAGVDPALFWTDQAESTVRSVFARYDLGGDYRAIDMILVIIVLILVGGRRLDHLNYLCEDPLVKRFCGLLRLPRQRSVGRWLKRFTHKSLAALVEINSHIVCKAIDKEKLGRLTLDIDGSVITTGGQRCVGVSGI